MNNKTYDFIKNAALFAAPIITLIASLVTIWLKDSNITPMITASLAAIDTALGAVVIVAKKIYDDKNNKGG